MIAIDGELIKRVQNGDLIVKGSPEEILKSKFEEGCCVVANLRESEELEVERSGFFDGISSGIAPKRKIPFAEIVNNDWYILEENEMR